MEHSLEKMDHTFQSIRMQIQENKKRGYTMVHAHYTVQLRKMLNGHDMAPPMHTYKMPVQLMTNLYLVSCGKILYCRA